MAGRPVDFDHHSHDYAADPWAQYAKLRSECPVAWSEQHGGFWVLSRYEDVATVARDDLTFSSRHDIPNDGVSYTGITIPGTPNRSTPIEMDPPEFPKFRRILNPPFAPAAIDKLRPRMFAFTDWCLDQVIESGSIDFIADLANPVPAMATLAFLGLDIDEWESFSWPFHDIVACPPGTEGWNKAQEGIAQAITAVGVAVTERRVQPRDDLLTHFTQVEVDGEQLSDEVILEICTLILGGGVDTTTALLGHAVNHLGHDLAARARIVADSDLIPLYCEELLRYHTPTQALARTATRDTVIGDQPVSEGERVLICWAGANRDPDAFDRPDELVIDRFPNRHAAFGLGGHRCLGSNFARAEFTAMLSRVLDRMPDYELADGAERYESIGVVNGWHRLPARFAPGSRTGATLETAAV
jgi:cytochrome P450